MDEILISLEAQRAAAHENTLQRALSLGLYPTEEPGHYVEKLLLDQKKKWKEELRVKLEKSITDLAILSVCNVDIVLPPAYAVYTEKYARLNKEYFENIIKNLEKLYE